MYLSKECIQNEFLIVKRVYIAFLYKDLFFKHKTLEYGNNNSNKKPFLKNLN